MPLIRLHDEAEVLCGQEGFLLVDHRTGQCLLLGSEERYLLHLLEKAESNSEVCRAFRARFGSTLTSRQVEEFIAHMHLSGVLHDAVQDNSSSGPVDFLNAPVPDDPFSFSTPGAKLNFFFDLLVLFFGWMLHPVCILPVLILMWMATNVLIEHGNELLLEHLILLGHYNIAFYLIFILVPKHFLLSCVEATFAGMACRRFGGRIRNAGIRLRLGLLPALQAEYDDSILMLPKRGRRTFMTIGIWSVLAIGSLAIIGASNIPTESDLQKICLLLILPCLVRLVIMCNLFFRFSGLYLLLADCLGERDLMEQAVEETRRSLSFLPSSKPMTRRRRFWLRVYGMGYYVYRIVLSGLILWAGWYISVNSMGLIGALLTIAVFVYFNSDIVFKNRTTVLKRSMPASTLPS